MAERWISRKAGRLLATAVATLTTALCLGACELALREIRPAATETFKVDGYEESQRAKFNRYDDTLGWRGVGGVASRFECRDCSHFVRHNSLGFRGTEHTFGRTDRPRLVILGDSFVWGYGVKEAEIFSSLLERKRVPATEVVNLGVSGYGTDQALLLWQTLGKRFEPDAVLLVLHSFSDIADNFSARRYGYPKPIFSIDSEGGLVLHNTPVPRSPLSAWTPRRKDLVRDDAHLLARLASRSALVASGLLAAARVDFVRSRLEGAGVLPDPSGAFNWGLDAHQRPASANVDAAWALLFRLLSELRKDIEANGARFSVAIAPTAFEVYPEVWQRLRERHSTREGALWDADEPRRRVLGFCRERGIHVIDLLEDLRAAGESDPFLYFPWNQHWRANAHRLVAEQLLRDPKL